MGGRVRQLAVELRRCDVDTVEERAPIEVQGQRHDGDPLGLDELRRKIGGGVGDDRDPARGHSETSVGCGSVIRLFLRLRMKRSSTGLMETRVRMTRTPEKIATA